MVQGTSPAPPAVSRTYAWLVFALTFGLMLSDYMSRQVLNVVFPELKSEWLLTDAQLGSLSSIVALMVGVLSLPLSLLADRWGRIRCVVLAAAVWSLATLGCAVSASYGQMFLARLIVGVGEAAYGSIGMAVVVSVFSVRLRATLSGTFMAGAAFGSVLGVSVGGVVAQHLGWRWAFAVMGLFGMALAMVYGLVVTEKRLGSASGGNEGRLAEHAPLRALLPRLFSSVSVVCVYVGSGLQMFIPMALLAWMPSFLNRYYSMPPARAGLIAGVFALITGISLIGGGIVADRVSRRVAAGKWNVAIACCFGSLVLLMTGFRLPTGPLQLALIGAGTLLVNATGGLAAALVSNLTPASIAATAFATLVLANNVLGLAPGPAVTGMLADRMGLIGALQVIPLVAVGAATAFAVGKLFYERDLRRLELIPDTPLSNPEPRP
ncbi:MFS transporter (plasmid) [Streptomyces sp. NBC_00147]